MKQLKEVIKNLPDDMEIIMQKDAEGNGYSPLEGIDSDCVYVPESSYSGSVYRTRWSAEEACMTDTEWEEMKRKPRSLVFYPVN